MTDPSSDFVMPNGTNSTAGNGSLPDPYGEPEEVSRAKLWAMATLMPLVILVILIGNTLVAIAVLKVRALQTIQNYYLVSLAASDLMVGGLIMPLSLVDELMGYWPMGRAMCDIYVTLDIFACTASILNLCAIGLDRHYAITQAVKYTATKTTKDAVLGISMVWTASAIICLPPLLGWGTDSFHTGLYPRCHYTDKISYVLYSTVGSFFGPLPIMLVVYTRIFIAARSRIRNLRKRGGLRRSANNTSTATNAHRLEVPVTTVTCVQDRTKEIKSKELLNSEVCRPPVNNAINSQSGLASPSILLRPDIATAAYSSSSGRSDCTDHSKESTRGEKQDQNGPASQQLPQTRRKHRKNTKSSPPRVLASPQEALSIEDVTVATPSMTIVRNSVVEDAWERRWKMMQAKERRLTVVICIVTGAFVTCWSPFFVSYVVRTVHKSAMSTALFRVFVWLGYCNSALNPIIYTLMNKDFRQAFKQVLIRKFSATFGVNK